VLEHSHVDLGSGFVDRAKERRLAELHGGHLEEEVPPPVVKGLDFELLKKVRAGEFVMPAVKLPDPRLGSDDDSDAEEREEEVDDDAILDELLKMETELQAEVEKKEQEEKAKKEKLEKETDKTTVPEQEVEKPAETKSRFKPVIDAKQLKQMRREAKRRKMAMQAMDQATKPTPPPPTAPTQPKKSRAELLEKLRQIQAAKKITEAHMNAGPPETKPQTTSPEFASPAAPSGGKYQHVPPPPEELSEKSPKIKRHPSPTPKSPLPLPRKSSPKKVAPPSPPVKVGDNMFSDESELSDYNPYGNASDSEAEEEKQVKSTENVEPVKRNYFNDNPSETEVSTSAPVTMDPTIAAALRKATAAAAAAEKRVSDQRMAGIEEEKKPGRMSLGGMDGVYEFDEVDTWDGEDEEEEIGGSKKRKRKAKER